MPPVLLLGVAFSCAICTGLMYAAEPPPGQEPLPRGLLDAFGNCSTCLVGLGLLFLLVRIIDLATTELIVTNRRIVHRRSIGSSMEIYINKVDSVVVELPPIGRLMEYGTLVVFSTSGNAQKLKNIRQPEQARYHILEQITKANKL